MGRAIPDGSAVTDDDWRRFERAIVAEAFPEGFTVQHVESGWMDRATGRTIKEPSIVLEVAHNDADGAMQRLHDVAASYKSRFRQDAVMLTTQPVAVAFI